MKISQFDRTALYIMKFLYFLGAFASPVLSQLTDLNPFGRCNRKCENELEKYFKSNNAATHCALLFDEDCCDPDGWALPIPQGKSRGADRGRQGGPGPPNFQSHKQKCISCS